MEANNHKDWSVVNISLLGFAISVGALLVTFIGLAIYLTVSTNWKFFLSPDDLGLLMSLVFLCACSWGVIACIGIGFKKALLCYRGRSSKR